MILSHGVTKCRLNTTHSEDKIVVLQKSRGLVITYGDAFLVLAPPHGVRLIGIPIAGSFVIHLIRGMHQVIMSKPQQLQ